MEKMQVAGRGDDTYADTQAGLVLFIFCRTPGEGEQENGSLPNFGRSTYSNQILVDPHILARRKFNCFNETDDWPKRTYPLDSLSTPDTPALSLTVIIFSDRGSRAQEGNGARISNTSAGFWASKKAQADCHV